MTISSSFAPYIAYSLMATFKIRMVIHPQKEGPIRISRTEGVVSQISSLTFSELGKNLRTPFKNFQIWNSAFSKERGPKKLFGTEISVSNVVVHYENYQWLPRPSNLFQPVGEQYFKKRKKWAGRFKNCCSHFIRSIAVWKVMNKLCTRFELNPMKIDQVSPFWNFWLVGWLDRSAWVELATEFKFKAHSHD